MEPLREQRTRRRMSLRWPLRLTRDGQERFVPAVTENLSSKGFYCLTAEPFALGEALTCRIEFPLNHTARPRRIVLLCRAEVLRVEPGSAAGTFGVACRIRDYSLEVNEGT
jgi:hypothetical protein